MGTDNIKKSDYAVAALLELMAVNLRKMGKATVPVNEDGESECTCLSRRHCNAHFSCSFHLDIRALVGMLNQKPSRLSAIFADL